MLPGRAASFSTTAKVAWFDCAIDTPVMAGRQLDRHLLL